MTDIAYRRTGRVAAFAALVVLGAGACSFGGAAAVDAANAPGADASPAAEAGDEVGAGGGGDGTSAGGGGSDGDAAAAGERGAPEKADLTVGLLPIIDVAPVFIGIEEGLFEAEGLNIETRFVQGGAAGIPAMIAGELDITFGAHPSLFAGDANGLDLRLIAEQNRASPGFTDIMALPGSGLADSPEALEGRRLALNTFDNTAELTARSVVEEAGGDFGAVEAVEIPFPEMVATLERGEVDAIWAVEPFNTIAASSLDAVVVSDAYRGRTEGLPVAGYSVTGNFATNFPNTVAAFQRAIIAATERAASDPDRVVAALPSYTRLDEDAARAVTQPEFVARIDRAEIGRVIDLMVDFEVLSERPDLDALIVPTP